jgi:histidine decarboxylase
MSYDPWTRHELRFPGEGARERLEALRTHFVERSAHYIGFPNSRLLSFAELGEFLRFNINNIGDPYHPNGGINTCHFEREVLKFWAEQLHLPPSSAWGYITNGSTEAIMYGIAQGRDRHEDAVLLFSEESHYCLHKIAHLLRIPHRIVASRADGSLDLESLATTIRGLEGRPFILNLTLGTTFHGAIESPEQVLELLERLHCRNFHLHIDAALYGPMLTWLEDAPLFDFRLPIHTLSFSGHKFMGAPMPCGVVLSHSDPIRPFDGSAEYVGSLDTTLSGSRDGLSALILWLVIQRVGPQGMAALAEESLQLAVDFEARMKHCDIEVTRHPHGCILVFPRPDEKLARRWQLATRGDFAHIVTVPGVTSEMLETFLDEWIQAKPQAFPGLPPSAATTADTTALRGTR